MQQFFCSVGGEQRHHCRLSCFGLEPQLQVLRALVIAGVAKYALVLLLETELMVPLKALLMPSRAFERVTQVLTHCQLGLSFESSLSAELFDCCEC